MPERAAGPGPEIVFHDGWLVPDERALVSVHDRGLLFGDGLFETVRVYSGLPFALDRHLRRLYGSLEALRIDIPESPAELSSACRDVTCANGVSEGVLRITITRGIAVPASSGDRKALLGLPRSGTATRIVSARPLTAPAPEEYARGVRATVSGEPFARPTMLRGHKTLNYLDSLAAKQEAHSRGAFEALWVDASGNLVEGASSNVLVVSDASVATPPLADGALPGVTREICLDLLAELGVPCDERSVSLTELSGADELLLTNSVIEILSATELDGVPVGDGSPGPVARQLSASYRGLVARST